MFEVLRHALPSEVKFIQEEFHTFPILQTPENLWELATSIGQKCRKHGFTAASFDLLIAAVAQSHGAVLITLDDDFVQIARHSGLRVELLRGPG